MSVRAMIVEDTPVELWGLSSRQRLERMLRRAGVAEFVEEPSRLPGFGSVLLVRGDYLYDARILTALLRQCGVGLAVDAAGGRRRIVAAHVPAAQAVQARRALLEDADEPPFRVETLATFSTMFEERLRKADTPYLLPIQPGSRRELERRLFAGSYKGVTDLVTKWVWPKPARWVTGVCARHGIVPNHVTAASLALVILAAILFARGAYGWGLLAAWTMTFLDTVDGKLARVTVSSTAFGHIFDHAIDLLTPPIWYVLWGLSLPHYGPEPVLPLRTTLWLIVAFYAVGRLAEGTFQRCLARFGIFCWRPIDSHFRLITARRNPNLLLLTAGALVGRPDLGLLAVALWTVVTSLFLVARLAMAWKEKANRGTIDSWLNDLDRAAREAPLAARWFTQRERPRPGGAG
ncbi:MAG: CDP-alcohol phosphatidyltransferase family protein [Deferrisomatales bacterium]